MWVMLLEMEFQIRILWVLGWESLCRLQRVAKVSYEQWCYCPLSPFIHFHVHGLVSTHEPRFLNNRLFWVFVGIFLKTSNRSGRIEKRRYLEQLYLLCLLYFDRLHNSHFETRLSTLRPFVYGEISQKSYFAMGPLFGIVTSWVVSINVECLVNSVADEISYSISLRPWDGINSYGVVDISAI